MIFLGKGLRELGQKYLQNICIFADTKAEWMIAAQVSLFSFPIATSNVDVISAFC